MAFKDNLIRARGHLVFLTGLAAGLALVLWLEDLGEGSPVQAAGMDTAMTAQADNPLAVLDTIEPLPLAIRGESSAEDLAHAAVAWRYFENNTNPETGLANSVNNYPSTTMWETGSYLVAVLSAERLGLIDRNEAEGRLSAVLTSLQSLRLFEGMLPNKAYHARTLELVNYQNQPVDLGLGWSALDIARMVGALGLVSRNHPALAAEVETLVAAWSLDQMVEDGELIGMNIAGDTLRRDQEGRVGYEQYAAKAMMLFGFDTWRAYEVADNLMIQEVEGQPIPVDTRLHRNVTPAFVVSEPYLFDGLEFGFDARSLRFASAIYRAQEARWARTGILTAVSESHIDEPPYFTYSSVWGGGAPWAVMTFSGDRLDSRRTVATKAAFAWDALFGTDYTATLVAEIAELADPERGWPEGFYEGGEVNGSVTANTNALVLAALSFKATGPLMRSAE